MGGLASRVLSKAFHGQDPNNMSDADIIKAIYHERGKNNSKGNLAYFSGNSQAVQNSVRVRYIKEEQQALKELGQ